jgi:ubiquinone/menaquinone biosynthesis C-methylase UbiE
MVQHPASMKADKSILDVTCGSKMMWFNKDNPNVMFTDQRSGIFISKLGRRVEVSPDILVDFTKLPFQDNSFKLVVFDPPHRRDLTAGNWMEVTYGKLTEHWQIDLKKGFDECMRVLEPSGVLIFKWNTNKVKVSKILSILEVEPLFGHTTSKNTIWMTFMKIPKP